MRYDLKNILWSLAAAAVLGLSSVSVAQAQGVLSLEDDNGGATDINDELGLSINSPEIPDSIELPAPAAAQGGMITPPAGAPAQPGKIVPKTGDIAPKTGGIVPKTGEIVPKTGDMPQNAGGPIALSSPDGNAPAPTFRPKVPMIEEAEVSVSETDNQPAPNPLDTQIFDAMDDEVFSQMSDLEKQTAILTLELRREKVKNEIEALQAQRRKALEEEENRSAEQKLKLAEKEREQEKQVLEERQKLRELDMAYEKLRQEKLLNNYKNKMLADNQKWIENNAKVYNQISQLKKENKEFIENVKKKMAVLTEASDQATKTAMEAKERYQREKASLQTQISILKARLEAEEKTNPFAEAANAAAAEQKEDEVRLNDVYVIMEIRGQGGKLAAKLINKDGMPFLVQEGTTLQTGQIVDEITTTYVRADKAGKKDYLYFSAGGILEKEPEKAAAVKYNMGAAGEKKSSQNTGTLPVSRGIPGIGQDMTIR